MYKKENGINDLWKVKKQWLSTEVSLPVYWHLTKRVSVYRFLFSEKFTKEMKKVISGRLYHNLLILRERVRHLGEDVY